MKAFHNDPKIKTKYVNRIKAHAKADEIVKGQYWKNGKGCAVGCTIHSGEHSAYETELGIPEWIARLEDRIFEGLPNARAMTWPLELLKAIKVGADLESIKIPMLIFICETSLETTDNTKARAYINGILDQLRKPVIDKQALIEARNLSLPYNAADAAAYAAAYAAAAANAAAYAAAAANAAADAAAYAAAAAHAAAANAAAYAAANAAARENTYVKFADKLLELIKA